MLSSVVLRKDKSLIKLCRSYGISCAGDGYGYLRLDTEWVNIHIFFYVAVSVGTVKIDEERYYVPVPLSFAYLLCSLYLIP